MATNTVLSVGVGGDTIRTIDRGTSKTQVTTLDFGGDAGPEILIGLTNGLPVQPATGSTFAVSAVSLPLPTGAAAAAKQDTGNTSVNSIDVKTPALGQALAASSVPVVLTAAQLTTLTPFSSVSVSNFPATQPVSGTVTANAGTNLNTSALALEAGHLAAIDTSTAKIPAQGQALAAASMPVVLTAIQQTALTPPAAITGFALEAGHLATIDTHIPALGQALAAASVPVVMTAAQLTTLTPIAGNLEATQLLVKAKTDNLDVALSTRLKPADTLTAVTTVSTVTSLTQMNGVAISLNTGVRDTGTQRVTIATNDVVPVTDNSGSLTVDAPVGTPVFVRLSDGAATLIGQKAMASSVPVVLASDQASVPVVATAPTLTKGTQGATGFSVQRLNDAGRNTRIFMLDTITVAPVAEALATVVQWYSNAAVAGTTTPAVVPSGKTLRLISWKIQYQSLATVGYAVVRVRCNTAGMVVLASPLVWSFEAGSGSGATTVAMTGGVTTETGDFPEGLEIPAAAGVGFSVAGYGPTGTLTLEGGVRFAVMGYEY